MRTYELATEEIVKAHTSLGHPMTKEDKKLLENMNSYELSQTLNQIRETVSLRREREMLEMSRELFKLQKIELNRPKKEKNFGMH